ncbi:period circadian protein isoform X2 [Drosophila grimshawi]|uniref:Period circadian protein n=1 Tax=Drosophila grimshawi TaxID=7222 RepID=B4JKJ9_DROGR|nr:period circadian protein isoform X2 [Drosophila grimshawi]EDW00102.1 GH12039 [Drosophila grimshawi]
MEGESSESAHNAKVADSAYSNSCSNSQSQRSGSSKSRLSGSHSSGSSGYGGKPSTQASSSDLISKRNKDKCRKKKKAKCPGQMTATANASHIDNAEEQKLASSASCEQLQNLQDTQSQSDQPASDQQQMSEQLDSELSESTNNQLEQVQQLLSTKSLNGIALQSTGLSACPNVGGSIKADKSWEATLGKLETVAAGANRQHQHPNQHPHSNHHPHHERSKEDSFCCVISMHDGMVLYTTPSITDVLGYPRDMWLGRSFIDFVHVKDRSTFASQITTGIPIAETRGSLPKDARSTCVMLRRYRGLAAGGFGVIGRSVNYEPFRLGLTFREAPEEARPDNYVVSNGTNMLLVITATPIRSSYKVCDEILSSKSPKFAIRHTAAAIISHVDSASVSALGYLPQDLIGRSIMDFYHHEDLPIIKETYEIVMKKGQTAGVSFCSKPYRFLIQNGCYILLETEWTSFVNPWSRRLEFVVGHHRVFQGPKEVNVFEAAPTVKLKIPDEMQTRNNRIKDDIVKLLAETVSRPSDTVKQEVSRRCQALASFMETLMDEVTRADLKLELPHENELTVSERDSVMLGEISPHHDYYDSKSSTETPPSYNQLNYKENLQRFFNSKPVTAPTELDPLKADSSYASRSREDARSAISPDHGGECSGGSGSSGNCTTNSNILMSSFTNTSNTGTGTSGCGNSGGKLSGSGAVAVGGAGAGAGPSPSLGADNSIPPISVTLTESLLSKHNDEMEKRMLKKHRESRGRNGEKNKKTANEKMLEYSGPGHGIHGIKRGGSHSWESDANKPKQQLPLNIPLVGTGDVMCSTANPSSHASNHIQAVPAGLSCTQNLWPPFSIGIPTPSVHTTAVAQSNFSPSLFPAFYYIPAQLPSTSTTVSTSSPHLPHCSQRSCEEPTTSQKAAAAAAAAATAAIPLQYMAGVMYPHPSLFYTHPAAAAATAMMYQPLPFSSVASNLLQLPSRFNNSHASYNKTVYTAQKVRVAPLSTTTVKGQGAFFSITPNQLQISSSVKAEPGSNVALSDSSKKEASNQPIESVNVEADGYTSDPTSNPSNHNTKQKYTDSNGNSDDMDGSSFSSFYSSFIKTTDGSDSPLDTEKETKHRKPMQLLQMESKIVEHPEEDQTQHGDG